MPSHYETLGVDPKAGQEEIDRAYRRAAKRTHPDHGGTDEAFQRVQRAGECLRDPSRRAAYDATGDDGSGPQPPSLEAQDHTELVRIWSVGIDLRRPPREQLTELQDGVRQAVRSLPNSIPKLEAEIRELQAVSGRLARKTSDASNAFEDSLAFAIAEKRKEIENVKKKVAMLQLVEELIKGHELTEAGKEAQAKADQKAQSTVDLAQRMRNTFGSIQSGGFGSYSTWGDFL